MNLTWLRGAGVALITPFRENGVDWSALEKVIEHVVQGGIDFIVSLGTTGEPMTMSMEECSAVLSFTLEKVNGRIPVIAGMFGSNDTASLVDRIGKYDLTGFAAIMSSTPSYTKPSQEGLFQHYMAVAEASPLPIVLYNVPSRTGCNATASTVVRLAEASAKFVAVKEASGDCVQAMSIMKQKPEGFYVLSGDDLLTLPLIGAGADGVISVIANAYPKAFSTMVKSALQGDFSKARVINEALLDIHPWLYVEGNPAGVKAILFAKNLCEERLRLPLVSVSDSTRQSLLKEAEKAELALSSLRLIQTPLGAEVVK